MFAPIDRLPGLDKGERLRCQNRWEGEGGSSAKNLVLDLIQSGAGEDFLQIDFENGRLPILDDMCDLRGLELYDLNITFPDEDTFQSIDFSYSRFWHCHFKNALFQSRMSFGRIYGCVFEHCTFMYGSFYATTFEKCKFVNCDFIDSFILTNCDLRNTDFKSVFTRLSIFSDCRFDLQCQVDDPSNSPNSGFKGNLDPAILADFYQNISAAYRAGGNSGRGRDYLFLSQRAATRHNSVGVAKLVGYAKELVFGYGLRPMNVLGSLLAVLVLGWGLFTTATTPKQALLLAAGALFTFGAETGSLSALGYRYSILYVFLAFLGISLIALFVVVLARVIFADE